MNILKTHGGKIWDTLFLLVRDNDNEFILKFVDRLPCDDCKKNFLKKIKRKNINFNVSKNECYRLLWDIRCNIHVKYFDKNNDEELEKYLKYLMLN